MPYAAGSFLFPTSTGDFSVTGVGFEPQIVVMFGSNQAAEDTLLTGLTGGANGRPGIFYSYNARDYTTDGQINSFCISAAGASEAGGGQGFTRAKLPVRMQDDTSASNIDYRANAITFDPDGFTITVTNAAPDDRPISWWACGSDQVVWASSLDDYSGTVAAAYDGGFPARSIIALSGPAAGFGTEATSNADSWLWEGGVHYPHTGLTLDDRWAAEAHTGLQAGTVLGDQGFTEVFATNGTTGNRLVRGLGSVGPALVDSVWVVEPTALHGSEPEFAIGGSLDTQALFAWTSAEGLSDGFESPSVVGNTNSVSVPAWFDRWELIMFATINGDFAGTPNAELRFGVGVLHPDYQGCAVFGDDGSFFQSRQYMAATCTSAAARYASGEIQGATYEVTTEAGGQVSGIYHGFGPLEFGWVPQMYRWWPQKRGRGVR